MELMKVTDWSKWQGRVGRDRIQRMKDDNVGGVVIGSWHGLDANPYAAADLADARSLGLLTSTYIVVNNRPGAATVELGRQACGSEWDHLSSVWIDVEVPGVTEAILQDALDAASRQFFPGRVGIYTGKWFWDMWRPGQDFSRYPLWTALYNGRFDLAFTHYGGWTEIVGHQYAGTTAAYGTTVDFNAFNGGWFNWKKPAPAESYPVPPREEPPAPVEEDELSSAEYQQLKATLDDTTARLNHHLVHHPGAPTPPAPAPGRTYTVKSGDTASGIAQAHGLTLNQLKAKNPGKPRSGNWNLIHPGEVFNV